MPGRLVDLARSCLPGGVAPLKGFRRATRVIERCLKRLQPLRDVQVQRQLLRDFSPADAPVPLRQELDRLLRHHRRKAEKGLDRLEVERTREFIDLTLRHLRHLKPVPGDEAAVQSRLWKRLAIAYERVIARRESADPGHVGSIHRVRVAFKKFRYMAEPAQLLLGEFPQGTQRAMKSLQEHLGRLQDTDVFLDRVDDVIRKDPSTARALALLRYWLLQIRPTQIREAIKLMDRLPAHWPADPFRSKRGARRPKSG